MKRQDLLLITVIVAISAALSYLISTQLIVPAKNHQQQAEIVQPITADFPAPSPDYFNSSAIDPTKPITVGQGGSTDPFSGN